MNVSGSEQDIRTKAQMFLAGILTYYKGTPEMKLAKAEDFIDSLLFKAGAMLDHPFSNVGRETYDIAYISKYVLIPTMRERLEDRNESDPFTIHQWH